MTNFRRNVSLAPVVPLLAALLVPASVAAAEDVSYWVEPCSVLTSLACAPEDTDLARWAFAAWEGASEGRLHLVESKDRGTALIRLVWAQKDGGLYGETEGIMVHGRRGAQIHVLAEPPNQGDRLLRDAIVYLTCLHESGHALGLSHTRAFADIMYSFQYGGDIEEYFGRYRRRLMTREDIRKNSGMSPADRSALIKSIGEGIFR
jgi:Matrixin